MAFLEHPQEEIHVLDDVMRERSMLVSVVIPTYNRAELMKKAACSVQSQTYPDFSFQVIGTDDASIDKTQNRIKLIKWFDALLMQRLCPSLLGVQCLCMSSSLLLPFAFAV
jgi:hypothetical protein